MSLRRKVVLDNESAGKFFMCSTKITAEGHTEIIFTYLRFYKSRALGQRIKHPDAGLEAENTK